MSVVYLTADFGKLYKQQNYLIFENEEKGKDKIFPHRTEQIVIAGNINITTSALRLLMKHKINTIFINKNGKFNGKISFDETKNVFLRLRQYKLLEDEQFKLKFSKIITTAKLKNQLNFMKKIKRERKLKENALLQIARLEEIIKKVESAENVDQVRGYEGIGARYYFNIYKYGNIQDWAHFNGRTAHPPQDEVNAVLSFLYTLIYYRIDSAISLEGLDPFVGFMHSIDYGKKTLAFDLMEEFRVPLADTLTLSLFNLAILDKEDFREVEFSKDSYEFPLDTDTEQETGASKKGILLTSAGLRKVIGYFEKKLKEQIFYEPLNDSVHYVKIIREQVKQFKRVINGEQSVYKPLIIRR